MGAGHAAALVLIRLLCTCSAAVCVGWASCVHGLPQMFTCLSVGPSALRLCPHMAGA